MENLQVIEVKEKRVLTTKQIAKAYGTEPERVKRNFENNKEKYKPGKHYIVLEGDELREFKRRSEFQSSFKQAKILYLWTEKGALLHAKSLNTDKAWEVYDYLVDYYFRSQGQQVQEIKETKPTEIKAAPSHMWTNGRLTPGKAFVADVPDNQGAQKLITDMRRYLAGMDALLDIYNMYNKEEDMQKITEVIKRMSSKIIWAASEIQSFKPKYVEKFI